VASVAIELDGDALVPEERVDGHQAELRIEVR
jgi:hypothetical protein